MAIKENVNINTKTSEKRGLSKFFRELKAEVKRITWPSKDDTKKALIAVGVVVLIYIVLVGGLDYIFTNYSISKAFDLSIASCSDGSIALGTLFCTNRFIGGLNFANITTVEKPLETDENLETLLVDKQALFFSQICKENIKDFYILKIVSDYFDEQEPTNEKIFELINNSISKWKKLI